ncbi:endonuclease 8-like 3 [Periophthalmus magnuspinnatus]|uniref:endonuclease 8-like 3 n=1 Tax=Periophthalmus magnuspinnatus TaxID=409849 RepID=UPI0024368BCA|nr:endonuclease 8-like 3 [Periophthalmus magnuspinnatus]
MVEGPGCTLNGEKIRARIRKGQTIKEIKGSLANSTTKPGGSPFHSLHGVQYSGVETLGKELFMYFGLKALRVHFGMNGSLRINPTVLKERSGQSQKPALEIHLTNDTVCFFDTTVEIRWTEDCEQRVRSSSHLDVCSPTFSMPRSEEAVRAQGGRMLCDVLLDQSVMPGVGNIIKNEALFDSGLHPAVKVQQLTDKQIHHLVKMTRDFTLLFYKCRKSGSPLHRHYKVYKRPQCGQCSHVITACRLGDHGRMTYFCERCQRGDPSGLDVSMLPVRNSLIGWVYREQPEECVGKKEEEDWICEVCTLINPPECAACDACLTARPKVHTEANNPGSSPYPSDLIKYPCTAFKKPDQDLKLNWRSAFGTSTLVFSDLTPNNNNNNQLKPLNSPRSAHLNSTAQGSHKHNICQGTSSPNYASGGWDKHDAAAGYSAGENSHPSKKMRIDNGTPNSRVPTATAAAAASLSSSVPPCPSAPCCSTHSRPAALRVVHKHGENKGRIFYTCSLPPETKCNFFEWADSYFPFCHHGKRCLMRTVLKLGPNNGRNFYTCSLIKGKQCDFFQWAVNAPGC